MFHRFAISPNHYADEFAQPLTIEDKITIFEDRVYGWQLDIADQMINGRNADGNNVPAIPHSGFAVLQVILSYFEMIGKYKEGFARAGSSGIYFKKGVHSAFDLTAFPEITVANLLTHLYEDARCGLYHAGMTQGRIALTGGINSPILFDDHRVIINPHMLVPALKSDLTSYITNLRDTNNEQLRNNFERRFDFDAS